MGGGDASLLIAPDGTTMLIDCNMSPITGKIVYYLQELGIEKLDYLMISHTDEDHVGGMNALLAYIQVDHILVSGSPYYFTNTSEAGRLVGKAIDMGASYTVLTAGMEMDFGGVNMKVYWPSADYEWPESQTGFVINNNSLVVKFTYGESSFLFAGDIYMEQEIALTEMYGEELHADVVKMNHHGHNTSNSLKWLTAVEPKLTCGMACAVFSSTVLNRYTYLGITFTLGALDGSVVVCTDGDGTYDVQVEKEREETYYGVLPATDGAFRIE